MYVIALAGSHLIDRRDIRRPVDNLHEMATLVSNKYQALKLVRFLYLIWYLVLAVSLVRIVSRALISAIAILAERNSRETGLGLTIDNGRYFPPALYPQVVNTRNFSHSATWYAVSAYMDMRPQAYADSAALTIVTGGPVAEVQAGATWFARLFILKSGAVITELSCDRTKYVPVDQHTSIHAAAAVICKTSSKWHAIQSISEDLGVCIIRSPRAFCDVSSIVPVGKPPRYPKYPMAWADSYFDVTVSRRIDEDVRAETEYLAGKGRIAVCVPGVRGDQYTSTLPFFLEYYRELGVDAVHLYMHSPGHEFARIAETIVAKQAEGSLGHLARLILLPWCMQLGASYRCNPDHPTIPLSGYDEFVGSNHGQILAHQDCLFRTMGAFRWALFVDLDEYIFPRRPDLLDLHHLTRASADHGVAPVELSMHMAKYESCLPSPIDSNVSIALSTAIDPSKLRQLPRPAWSAARVTHIWDRNWFPKFLCDPMRCDRMAIHRADTNFCDRYPGQTAKWATDCTKRQYVSSELALVHHTRAFDRMRKMSSPHCDQVSGVHEVDWSFTNFVMSRLETFKTSP